ncbi:MAG TPA: chromate efflux transporter, partial [Roseiarcus sp.]|nr:chromate efflux transporter [Roseiarcus sp.]
RLGVSSFGGPIAHLGYFRQEFVVRRRWLDERAFADLVALCQFLPGPASSQVGFSLGLMRAGYRGGLAAWLGFTLPSAILLVLFAYGASVLKGAAGEGLLHGLKLVAVAIVAQAVLGMARTLCPDKERAAIAALALILVSVAPGSLGQVGAIILGGLAGLAFCRGETREAPEPSAFPITRRMGLVFLVLFFVLLALAFTPAQGALALAGAFYRSGALVFGGGHVVLPLLRSAVVAPGWVADGAFLAGYGAAQAVPGPLFTFSAYLGAVAQVPPGGIAGAALALVSIFVPGLLALMAALPFWRNLSGRQTARAAMAGINAVVVGLLGAALYNPVFVSAVQSPADFAIAAAGFVLLAAWRAPPLLVVALCAAAGLGVGVAVG